MKKPALIEKSAARAITHLECGMTAIPNELFFVKQRNLVAVTGLGLGRPCSDFEDCAGLILVCTGTRFDVFEPAFTELI